MAQDSVTGLPDLRVNSSAVSLTERRSANNTLRSVAQLYDTILPIGIDIMATNGKIVGCVNIYLSNDKDGIEVQIFNHEDHKRPIKVLAWDNGKLIVDKQLPIYEITVIVRDPAESKFQHTEHVD